jgi:hypothetical protein
MVSVKRLALFILFFLLLITPICAQDEVAPELPVLEGLSFVSGEAVSFDAATSKLSLKVYLDPTGDANEHTLTLAVNDKTEITDGEAELNAEAIQSGAEMDVEYNTKSMTATYIFIY